MIFDQYSRYKACSDLLRRTGFIEGNSVLDIGSGPECLFGQFMPDATMSYVDPLITEGSGQGRISGTVFAKELDGRVFDGVSAVDVLEHVPPEHRQSFLKRMSSLGKNTLILGFPTLDSSDALETDKAIDDQYRAIFGHDYSWLEEHHRFGLPSLAATVEQLTQMGWHCQAVGHGHAPWLQELLGFVICAWDIPSLKNLVLEISEKFNQDLYPYDFQPPFYRQFVIASRSPLPTVAPPVGAYSQAEAESIFQALMDETRRRYFCTSMQQLANPEGIAAERDAALIKRNAALAEHDVVLAERDTALAKRSAALAARDVVLAERNAALAERDAARAKHDDHFFKLVQMTAERDAAAKELALLKNSKTWRLMHFVTALRWIVKNRTISDHDRACIKDLLRRWHHKLPHPLRQLVQWGYFKIFGDPSKVTPRVQSTTQFQPPVVPLSSQTAGLPDYIIWGVIDWHFRIQRPQHLACELAATGRRVFYVSAQLIDDERAGFEVEPLDSEGRLFQVKLYVSTAPRIYYSAPGIDIVRQMRASIGEVLQWADSHNLISFVQHTYWVDVARALPNSRMVYDCMDHHEGFGNVSEELLALERSLLHDADLTITTSEYLDQIVAGQTKNSVVIRNAGEFEHFAKRPTSIYRDQQGRKVIGYYGAIAEWFDQDLVEAIATRFSQCRILLVGADTANAKHRLGRLPNVEFVGEVPYAKLPYYLYGFDVCLLPFKVIPLTLATNPVKVYEYLSSGKSVVTVDLPEMKQFGDLIKVADSTVDFLAAIDAALNLSDDPTTINKRRAFAKEQTWKHRVATLISHVESIVDEPKVSVIVVTYNNLDFTKACLASLDKFTNYTPMEIIVVDNASSDGSKKFLAEWVATAQNRQLILNDDNKGFAAANNQGLAIATGDYLVLLNNDTYVTPGWVRTLIKHLQRDTTIGLIGPVTNNIGNEAKIDIHYVNMDEMLQKSAVYTRQHIGQTYPLKTAAFFCVLMSRSIYEQVGPLDEVFGRGFFEDDDYCRRIEQIGMRVACAEDVFVHHHLSASFNKLKQQDRQKLFEDNKKFYESKWGKWEPHSFRRTTS